MSKSDVMGTVGPKPGGRYTYADYLTWDDGERWELIDGVAYPAHVADSGRPLRRHQDIVVELLRQFANHLLGKLAAVYTIPFDVYLPAPGETEEKKRTAVQPDLVVVCDPAKLDDKGCNGAPDLVIEVISPESAARDLKERFSLYEQAGVPEFWTVHPWGRYACIYHRGVDGLYGKPIVFASDERVPVGVLPELEIDLATVFAE